MKSQFIKVSLFLISLVCFIISINLFWNLAIFVDEFNANMELVSGGKFWNTMNWLRLGLTGLLTLLTGVNIFIKDNEKVK